MFFLRVFYKENMHELDIIGKLSLFDVKNEYNACLVSAPKEKIF